MSEPVIQDTDEKSDNPAPGKREQTKANNKAAILSAAQEVFAELGYEGTTVRDIIRKTNLASGTFYNYFKSKEEVFEALMDDRALKVRPKLNEVRKDAADFPTFLRETFRSFFEFVAEDQQHFALVRRNTGAIRVRMDTPEVVAGFEELQNDLEQAMKIGFAPKVDPDFLAASMIGIAFEVSDRMLMREPVDVEGATEFATALLLGGIGALPEGSMDTDRLESQ